VGYGVTWGALAGGALAGRDGSWGLWRGGLFGAGLWLFGTGVLFPWLRIARPFWNARVTENVTNAAAHVVYGMVVQLMAEELTRQRDRRRTSDPERHGTRVG
jgi:uncharacterized membrane protein YagU involved in acid resistance